MIVVLDHENFVNQIRKLRAENNRLKEENRSMNETLITTIGQLQSQMTQAMGAALQKKVELEKKLADTRKENEILQARLSELESESD
jgi:BMFP domain-containing protein YqiC